MGTIVLTERSCDKPDHLTCLCMRKGKKHSSRSLPVHLQGKTRWIYLDEEREAMAQVITHNYLRRGTGKDAGEEDLLKDRPWEGAFIPGESRGLESLERVNTEVVRCAGKSVRATVDLDATIIESHKRQALFHDKGGRGYQPVLATGAEEDLVLADEFRDGNVPAGMEPVTTARKAFAALPSTLCDYSLQAFQDRCARKIRSDRVWRGGLLTISGWGQKPESVFRERRD